MSRPDVPKMSDATLAFRDTPCVMHSASYGTSMSQAAATISKPTRPKITANTVRSPSDIAVPPLRRAAHGLPVAMANAYPIIASPIRVPHHSTRPTIPRCGT